MSESVSAAAAAPIKIGTKFLGKSGLKVSELCLGTMTFGTSERNAWGLPTAVEDESFAIMNRYYSAGGFFIDTGENDFALVYGLLG